MYLDDARGIAHALADALGCCVTEPDDAPAPSETREGERDV
jgi:hypothetical protein